jgi:RimJ/RimL family protein N-acetyltransferase
MSIPEAPIVVHAEGLVLREWSREDLPTMVELFDDAEVDRWTPLAHPFDAAAANAYLVRAHERRASGTLQLAITEGLGEPLGEVLLFPGEQDGACELGYMVGASHRGRQLASRAVRAMLPYASQAGYLRAQLVIPVGNVASEKVGLTAGFVRVDAPLERVERKGYVLQLARWTRALPGPN